MNKGVWGVKCLALPHFFGFQQFVCSHVKAELQAGYLFQTSASKNQPKCNQVEKHSNCEKSLLES